MENLLQYFKTLHNMLSPDLVSFLLSALQHFPVGREDLLVIELQLCLSIVVLTRQVFIYLAATPTMHQQQADREKAELDSLVNVSG